MSCAVRELQVLKAEKHAASIISDGEWKALVEYHFGKDKERSCYYSGYLNGQHDALQIAAEIAMAIVGTVADEGSQRMVRNLASILVLMTSETQASPVGSC
ncbi:hypothetical protein LO749_04220 [Paracoccus denitrificans]|uniref:hypothetical protein n=1 Tax=Paracoccus denitrificans TaxID=266 RepID=UPI001E436F6F|nr:hypothetical protein [Paracoccus denitrificans]UFS65774.1 hypothetical protein LO749_04220 [Paracoccus denitrificans]